MNKTKENNLKRANMNWGKDELDLLEEKWGTTSIPQIAENLSRSIGAVVQKSQKIGLGKFTESGEHVVLNQLILALGLTSSYGWHKEKWQKHGIPTISKKVKTKHFTFIKINDFWIWAEKNKIRLDFSKFEKHVLGAEPDWVAEKRRLDILAAYYKKTPWTKREDEQLIKLLNANEYGYRQMSVMLNRTEGAIKRRMCTLGIKRRPLKADNHNPWTEEEVDLLVKLASKGYSMELIAEKLPKRSGLAVRGKLERIAMNNDTEDEKRIL